MLRAPRLALADADIELCCACRSSRVPLSHRSNSQKRAIARTDAGAPGIRTLASLVEVAVENDARAITPLLTFFVTAGLQPVRETATEQIGLLLLQQFERSAQCRIPRFVELLG